MGRTADSTSWTSRLFEEFVHRGRPKSAKRTSPPATLRDLVEDAEQLLIYATECGMEMDRDVTTRIVGARHPGKAWEDSADAADLVDAVAALAAKTQPVTAETLRMRRNCASQELLYSLIAVALIVIIFPLSWISFDANQLSKSISADIAAANALTVTLHTKFDSPVSETKAQLSTIAPPPGSLGELQEFASTIRMIRDHALLLNEFWLPVHVDKSVLPSDKPEPRGTSLYEIDPGKPISLDFMQHETRRKTELYQKVRNFAKVLQDRAALTYGALAAYLLPTLYAALGVCAALLRTFQSERTSGSFSDRHDIAARFLSPSSPARSSGSFRVSRWRTHRSRRWRWLLPSGSPPISSSRSWKT